MESTDPDQHIKEMVRELTDPMGKVASATAQTHQLELAQKAAMLEDQRRLLRTAAWKETARVKKDPETGLLYYEGRPPGEDEIGDIRIGPEIHVNHVPHEKTQPQAPPVQQQSSNGNGMTKAIAGFLAGTVLAGPIGGLVGYNLNKPPTVIQQVPAKQQQLDRKVIIQGLPGE